MSRSASQQPMPQHHQRRDQRQKRSALRHHAPALFSRINSLVRIIQCRCAIPQCCGDGATLNASRHAGEPEIVGEFPTAAQGAMLPAPMKPLDAPSHAPGADASSNSLQTPHRLILDTQVVMDWLVFRESSLLPLVAQIESGHSLWIATVAMHDELRHVLSRGVAARYQPDPARIDAAFRTLCRLVDAPTAALGRPRCSDPDDQKFIDLGLSLATAGPVTLISRDRAVLKVAKRAAPLGLSIVSPSAWLKQQVHS